MRGHYVVSRLEFKMAILAHASVLRGFLALFLHTYAMPQAPVYHPYKFEACEFS